MKCIVPKNSGFCFGVSLAVKAAYENAGNSAYMYGEVVHNPLVVNDLISRGLPLVNNLSEISTGNDAKILIRAHGVPKAVMEEVSSLGLDAIDKTCPKVKKIHDIVSEASNRGLDVIVVGKPNHPEVNGIMGWCSTRAFLFDTIEDAKAQVPDIVFSDNGICMVSQTTHNDKKYKDIHDYCSSVLNNIEFHDTICAATSDRQSEIRELAQSADSVIVVGGKKSSNVTKLYEIASEYCDVVYHVENEKEIDVAKIGSLNIVVIASGASTPNENVESVVTVISEYCNRNNINFELERR